MPSRLSLIFKLTTAPTNRATATNNTAGWSESFWDNVTLPSNDPTITALATARARLLPKQAASTGYRIANYTLSGNRALPTGTSSAKQLFPGNAAYDCDLPQVALECSAKGPSGPNSSRFTLRGIPDDMMKFGEYQPTTSFISNFNAWKLRVETDNWWFLGRDLSVPATRITNITPDVVVAPAPPTFTINYPGPHGVVVNDYVRLNRCKDDNGDNVTGPFLVVALTAGGIQVTGMLPGTRMTRPSGTIRKDLVAMFFIRQCDFSRATVRKVGRPSGGYRGRQSKR